MDMGCVPSKSFLKCASVVHNARTAQNYGVKINGTIEDDFTAIMTRIKQICAGNFLIMIQNKDLGKTWVLT